MQARSTQYKTLEKKALKINNSHLVHLNQAHSSFPSLSPPSAQANTKRGQGEREAASERSRSSYFVQNVKTESSKWIKEKKFCAAPFAWQEGYGAFSYSKSHVPDVIRYIQNQETHHKKQTFLDEYRHFLKAFEIEYRIHQVLVDSIQ